MKSRMKVDCKTNGSKNTEFVQKYYNRMRWSRGSEIHNHLYCKQQAATNPVSTFTTFVFAHSLDPLTNHHSTCLSILDQTKENMWKNLTAAAVPTIAITRRMIKDIPLQVSNTRKATVVSNYNSFYSFISPFHSQRYNNEINASFRPYVDFGNIKEGEDAIRLFKDMIKMKPRPSISVFNKLINLVVKMKRYDVVLHLFDEMRQLGVPFDEFSLHILINCYCLLQRPDLGFAIVGTFFKCGFVPCITTFTSLIRGLFLTNNVAEAEILFKKLLREKLCEPDAIMIATVINGLCKAGRTHVARKLISLLEKGSCKLNAYAYAPIIDSLCKEGMIDDACLLFTKMIDNGISPGVVTYNSLIKGFCDFGRWEDTKDLLNEMISRNIPPSIVTYSTLIDAFCKEGKVKEAEGVLEIMIQRNIAPDIVTYDSLIDGYCLRGEMQEARKVYTLLSDSGLKPSILTYCSLMNGYCKKGDVDEAWNVFLEIPRAGLEHDTISYNTMLHGLLCAGRIADGWKLFNEMLVQHHATPDLVTYNSLIDGLCRNQQIVEAFSVLSMMEDNGINPNIVTYNTLIHGLCQVGKLDVAIDLLSSLPSKGLWPNVITFNIIIHALCKEGGLDEAQGMFLEMRNCGCVPNNGTYNVLVQSFIIRRDFDKAKPILDEMVNKGFSLNAATLSALLRYYREDGGDCGLKDMFMKLVPKHKI